MAYQPWAYMDPAVLRQMQSERFRKAALSLGQSRVNEDDWNRIFGGQTASDLDRKYTSPPSPAAEAPAAEHKKPSYGTGFLKHARRAGGDLVKTLNEVKSGNNPFDDALNAVGHTLGMGWSALTAPKEYGTDPLMAIAGGMTSQPVQYDEAGNPYRDVHKGSKHAGPIDVESFVRAGKSIGSFAKDPRGQYQEGRAAWHESLNSPETSPGVRVAVETATDPTLYIAPGAVGKVAARIPEATRAGRVAKTALTARYSPIGAMAEGLDSKRAIAGLVAGSGLAAEAASRTDAPPWLQAAAPVAGAVAGAALAKNPRAFASLIGKAKPRDLLRGEAPVMGVVRESGDIDPVTREIMGLDADPAPPIGNQRGGVPREQPQLPARVADYTDNDLETALSNTERVLEKMEERGERIRYEKGWDVEDPEWHDWVQENLVPLENRYDHLTGEMMSRRARGGVAFHAGASREPLADFARTAYGARSGLQAAGQVAGGAVYGALNPGEDESRWESAAKNAGLTAGRLAAVSPAALRAVQAAARGEGRALLEGDTPVMGVTARPSAHAQRRVAANARATARAVGADMFNTMPAADVRAGEAAYLNSRRGRLDNALRRAVSRVPALGRLDPNVVREQDIRPFMVQERTRLQNITDSYEGIADHLMQNAEHSGLASTFDPTDGNYYVNVGGQRLLFGDLVEGRTPAAQAARAALNPQQAAALQELADFNARLGGNIQFHGGTLPYDPTLDQEYFPRVVVGADGTARVAPPGGPWARERTYSAMAEGVEGAQHINYADPRAAYRAMVRSKLKTAADMYLSEALRPLGMSADDVLAANGVPGVTHVELGPNVAPSLNGVYFDAAQAERILGALRGQPAFGANAVRAVNSALTPLRAMGDISWFGQQGAAFLFRHPIRAAKAAVVVIKSAVSDRGSYARMLDGAIAEGAARAGMSVQDYRQLLISHGLHVVPEEMGERGIGFSAGAQNLPGIGHVARFSNETFARFLNFARVSFANDAVELATKTGQMDQLQGALAAVNRMTGATGRAPSSLESLVEFAPRFFSAAVEQVWAATTKGGLEGTIARRHLLRMLGTGALMAVGINTVRGYDTDFDPTSENFLRIRNVGGLDVSLFGTYNTLFRAVASTMATGKPEPLLRLAEGKLSPVADIVTHTFLGRTYLGSPLDPTGNPLGSAYTYGKSMMPFPVQSVVAEGIEPAVQQGDPKQLLRGLESTAASATGFTSTPMTPTERLNEARGKRDRGPLTFTPETVGKQPREGIAQQEFGGRDYADLTGAEKSQINERPQIKDLQAEVDRNVLSKEDDRAALTEKTREIGGKVDALSAEFEAGQISGNDFRDQYRKLQDELRGARDVLTKRGNGKLDGWFALYDQASLPDGRTDYDRLDALQAAYRAKNPGIDEEVLRAVGAHDNETLRKYREAQKLASAYYSIPAYRGLSLEDGQTAGRVIGVAQAMVSAGQARTMRQAFAILSQQDKDAVRLARIAMNRGANPERKKFRRANPLYSAFYGDVAAI